jgi:hypothetical protein
MASSGVAEIIDRAPIPIFALVEVSHTAKTVRRIADVVRAGVAVVCARNGSAARAKLITLIDSAEIAVIGTLLQRPGLTDSTYAGVAFGAWVIIFAVGIADAHASITDVRRRARILIIAGSRVVRVHTTCR